MNQKKGKKEESKREHWEEGSTNVYIIVRYFL